MKEFYAEVKCDYNNDEGYWCVDAWRTGNDNEEGKVVAAINDKTGDVFYCEPEARLSPKVTEVIKQLKDVINGKDVAKSPNRKEDDTLEKSLRDLAGTKTELSSLTSAVNRLIVAIDRLSVRIPTSIRMHM